MESTIDRWVSHTQLSQASNLKRGKSSVFNASIVSKVNEALNDKDGFQRLVDRSQQKREVFRILGKNAEDMHEQSNAHIFNDGDYYQLLLSEFLHGGNDDENPLEGDDKEMVGLNMT